MSCEVLVIGSDSAFADKRASRLGLTLSLARDSALQLDGHQVCQQMRRFFNLPLIPLGEKLERELYSNLSSCVQHELLHVLDYKLQQACSLDKSPAAALQEI